jgi:predicted RNA-binding Zn-ribbon protein involved in translation (DUF1610 family)
MVPKMDSDLTLVIVLLIVLGIALFFEFRYIRGKKDDTIDLALNKDEAFNTLNTTQAVSRALKDRGRDTGPAEMELLRASLAYDRRSYVESIESVKKAKKLLDEAPTLALPDEPEKVPLESDPSEEEEKVQEHANIGETRKLPPNYLESKFMINTAGDEIEKSRSEGKDVTASVCLLDEAKMAFDCKDYDVALRKSLKAKKGAEGTSEPVVQEVVRAAPPAKMVRAAIVEEPLDTVRCANCGVEARDDDSFCAKCGRPIERKQECPKCGAEISDEDVFCRKCGTEVKTAYQCPECGAAVTDEDPVCVKCGARFEK